MIIIIHFHHDYFLYMICLFFIFVFHSLELFANSLSFFVHLSPLYLFFILLVYAFVCPIFICFSAFSIIGCQFFCIICPFSLTHLPFLCLYFSTLFHHFQLSFYETIKMRRSRLIKDKFRSNCFKKCETRQIAA